MKAMTRSEIWNELKQKLTRFGAEYKEDANDNGITIRCTDTRQHNIVLGLIYQTGRFDVVVEQDWTNAFRSNIVVKARV